MKHDTTTTTTNIHIVEKQSQEHITVKCDRKTLHVLQPGAGLDKENLVGGGRPLGHQSTSKDSFKPHKETIEEKNLINETVHKKVAGSARKKQKLAPHSVSKDKVKISVEDLTSQESPSESYWCVLAEKRRLALEDALEENMRLHEKIALLEQEVETQKMMLSETTSVIEVLKDLVADVSDESIISNASQNNSVVTQEDEYDSVEDVDLSSDNPDLSVQCSENADLTSQDMMLNNDE